MPDEVKALTQWLATLAARDRRIKELEATLEARTSEWATELDRANRNAIEIRDLKADVERLIRERQEEARAKYAPLREAARDMFCLRCDAKVGWPQGGCGICNPLRAALKEVVGD